MFKIPFQILLQYLVPQHALTYLAGLIANNNNKRFKNFLINKFIKRYNVNMNEALYARADDYKNFNDFFTRSLKQNARTIDSDSNNIISPVDGIISQKGTIEENTLIQAKGRKYSLNALLGNIEREIEKFKNGSYATFYLSPKDYHRIHMPISGKLNSMHFIPGKLFSVNTLTTQHIDNIFARNERVVITFDTEIGPMALILVGAIIVGNIHTIFNGSVKSKTLKSWNYPQTDKQHIFLEKGMQMGHFQLGSTVIVLFAKDKITLNKELTNGQDIKMGQAFANLIIQP